MRTWGFTRDKGLALHFLQPRCQMGVRDQRNAPVTLPPPPEKTRYLLYRSPGGPQGRSGRMGKIWPQPRFDPWTAQPIASRYTYCAISTQVYGKVKKRTVFYRVQFFDRVIQRVHHWTNKRIQLTNYYPISFRHKLILLTNIKINLQGKGGGGVLERID
jgi:hypothetical protein